jgi:hypothetical protein
MIKEIIAVLIGCTAGGLISWFSAEIGAKEERVKILAFLWDETKITTTTILARSALSQAAAKIKSKEHLK